MNYRIKIGVIVFCFLLLFSSSAFAQVRVSAQIDSSADIYVGEDFGYYIVIEGADTAGQADMSVMREYNPRSNGTRTQSSTQIVNNKVTTTRYFVMTYVLNAKSQGRVQLPSVTVTVGGKKYQTNPVQVNILKPGTTDQLYLDVELSEERCYVGQPVIMTVKFFVSANVDDFNFNIPAFNSGDFYLEDTDTENPQAKDYSIGNGVVVKASQYRTTRNGKDAILFTFSKVLIPKQAGTINIEPASVSADVAVGRTSSSSIFDDFFGSGVQYKRFMVSSRPAQLEVITMPEQGKPDDFYGLVGKYSIASSASPTEVSVGDPITLNIKIGGNKYLKPVQWPNLEQIPELAENFKIPAEKASPVIEDGVKVYTQTIRANNDKITEIPSIPLVYFDTDKGQYVTAKTDPIKLSVSPTKILTTSDLQGSDFTTVNREVEAIKQGLSANYHDLSALKNQDFSILGAIAAPGYLVVWAGPLAVLLFSVFTKLRTLTNPEKEAQKRRRSASGRVVNQLKNISAVNSHEQIEQFALLMKQYIGDRFDKTAGSLTSDECYEIITESTGDVQTARKYKEIIADCEAARYSSAGANVGPERINEAIDLILNIEKIYGK